MSGAAAIAAKTGAKKWTTIGPDYAFGHQSWEFFGKYLKEQMPDAQLMTETAFPRFGAEDFTPFINGVMENNPMARSEEHTSELQSLMRISYAVFCLKKKKKQQTHTQ